MTYHPKDAVRYCPESCKTRVALERENAALRERVGELEKVLREAMDELENLEAFGSIARLDALLGKDGQ